MTPYNAFLLFLQLQMQLGRCERSWVPDGPWGIMSEPISKGETGTDLGQLPHLYCPWSPRMLAEASSVDCYSEEGVEVPSEWTSAWMHSAAS